MGLIDDIKDYVYECPHCHENLNGVDGIVFKTVDTKQKTREIYLNPKIGDYSNSSNFSDFFDQNEKIDFYCVHCNHSLISTKNDDYVEINLIVNEYVFFPILFSKYYGVKKTFLLDENYIEEFGDSKIDNIDNLFEI